MEDSLKVVLFVEKPGFVSARQRLPDSSGEVAEVTLTLTPACVLGGQDSFPIHSKDGERPESIEVFASQPGEASAFGIVRYRDTYRIEGL